MLLVFTKINEFLPPCSIPCKIAEHILVRALNNQLDNILSNSMVLDPDSHVRQLVVTYHEIAKLVDCGNVVHALVFRKAFDVVPHRLLIQKMVTAGIDSHLIAWVQHFLTNRKQRVVIQGRQSESITVSSGVPQGSVVGPKLFLLYINDLPDIVSCKISLFADDTLIFCPVNNLSDFSGFQSNINKISEWSDRWCMSFNVKKTQLLIFNNKSNIPHGKYMLKNSEIDEISHATYLGVVFQNDLKFNLHIENKVNKASKILGLLKRTLYDAPKKTKLLAYTTICRPILEYGSQVWDPHLRTQCHTIERVQNLAIRFICGLKGRADSITTARQLLGIETLEERRRNARIVLLSKLLSSGSDTFSTFIDEYTNAINSSVLFTRSRGRDY